MNRLVGKKAPEFNLSAVSGNGENFININLDDYKGKWLILLFYPLDFTFVCPTEITSFSEQIEIFDKQNTSILGISTDSVYSHQAWIRNGLGEINFPLCSDKTQSLSKDYGVLLEDEGISLRGTFIIDPNQILRYSLVHDNNIGRSTDEIARVVCALQTDSLCGANWQIGNEPLKIINKEPSTDFSITDVSIKIYTQPNCSYCNQTKQFLKENNFKFTEIDLTTDKDGQLFMESRCYTALPVTVINDTEIVGFRLDLVKKALNL